MVDHVQRCQNIYIKRWGSAPDPDPATRGWPLWTVESRLSDLEPDGAEMARDVRF